MSMKINTENDKIKIKIKKDNDQADSYVDVSAAGLRPVIP